MITDNRFSDEVEALVTRIEDTTDAEVVVVGAGRSGSYSDLVVSGAAGFALLTLIVLMVIPAAISPILVVIDLIVAYYFARWALDRDWFLRLLASSERTIRQVEMAAAAEFHIEAVHSTPGRLGLLVYVSAFEGRVELVPDVGLQAKIPRGRWAEAADEFSHDDLDHFLAGMREVGELLAAEVPRTDAERFDLDDAPRIRS